MYVESSAISPWAKLMTPVERWMITSASASSAKTPPEARPDTICCMKSEKAARITVS